MTKWQVFDRLVFVDLGIKATIAELDSTGTRAKLRYDGGGKYVPSNWISIDGSMLKVKRLKPVTK